MTQLINSFKQDHALLMETLTSVKKLGIGKKEGQEKLMAAKIAFLDHLGKEDRQMYPSMKRAAATDERLQKRLDLFAKDMDEISKGAMTFFQKYSSANKDTLEFAKDFGKLFSTVKNRIYKEETILYPEYDKIA